MKLLCQLWTLNESLQDYKKSLEEEEESQREVASILESHLEEIDDDDEDEGLDDDEELVEHWQHANDKINSEKGKYLNMYFFFMSFRVVWVHGIMNT